MLQMLLKRRVDAVLANHLAMERLLTEQNAGDRVRSVLQRNRPLGVYFSQRFTAAIPVSCPVSIRLCRAALRAEDLALKIARCACPPLPPACS